MSRELILEAVRRSLAGAHLPDAGTPPAAPLPAFEDLAAAFRASVEALGGRVVEPEPEAALGVVVERVREAAGAVGAVFAWDPAELPLPGLGEALADAGIARLVTDVPAAGAERAARLAELERAPLGLTGAHAGVAETGTLIVSSGAGRPRLAWLLPPLHLALVPRARLHATLEAALAAHPELCRDAEVAFISGPSRTADIELTLTRGVHGPRELEVVLLG